MNKSFTSNQQNPITIENLHNISSYEGNYDGVSIPLIYSPSFLKKTEFSNAAILTSLFRFSTSPLL